jgi:hypothetical protein
MYRSILLLLCLSVSCLAPGGCTIIGVIAAKTIPQTEDAKYVGLMGQPVGVMVWADRAVRIDFDRIQLDIANNIQAALKSATAAELKDATFPVQPASIVRYQRDHPYIETMPVTEFAAELGVTRLIYVELERFSTRSDFAYTMYRGTAVATLKIVEIDPATRQAVVAFEENGVTAGFPRKGPVEGEVVGTDAAFYGGTIQVLTEEIVKRLVKHEVDQ